MSSSILSNIPVPTLTRMEVATASRRSTAIQRGSGSGTTDDIALEDIKQDAGLGFAAEAQEDPRASVSREAGERDPLELRGKILNDGELNELRQRKKSGKITQFYEDQNDHIERLLKPMHVLTSEAQEEENDAAGSVRWAIRLSLYANFALAGLQLYAAISSLSLSLFATCIDAVFDPFANILLNVLHKRAKKADEKKWPIGGSRFESSNGNIVYGALMAAVNLILIVESIRSVATHDDGETNDLYIPALVSVGIAFVTKFSLFLFCYSLRKRSSQVQVLYEDHRNDCFVNAFGVGMSAAGAKIAWWIDPMGAIIIAVCISFSWCRTIYEQFQFLAGIAAPVDFQQLVIYKAMTFSNDIKAIDSCRVCHSGPEYHVEIDIVVDGEMPLWKAHDIAQDLQDQLEDLPNINRCFVHIDHETEHKPEHRKHA
ncbi:hypothetical protein NCC49_004376 [Naganishia albida]|nr:hypothetical protein NCC49_004376 [Naganishia albida]